MLDFSDDWEIWDNVESVALVTGVRTNAFTNWTVTGKRLPISYKELVASAGAYTMQDITWLIPTKHLPANANPRLGDRIEPADGTSWTVTEATLNTLKSYWRLTTRNLVLVHGLADTANLMRPENQQDSVGARLPVYANVSGSTSLPIRVQETEAVVENRNGKRQATRKFTGYVGRRIYPQANDRIVTSDGTIYQLTGWRNADRLDLLMELDLEIVQ